jgi:hypothetical protein
LKRIAALFILPLVVACLLAACGSASAPVDRTPESAVTTTPVTFIFVSPEDMVPPSVTPVPGRELDYSKLVMAHPGDRTKEYDGVVVLLHQAAPQDKMLLINKEGLKRLLDFLNQNSKTKLVFIVAPDDKEMMSPYDPEGNMLVVQVHASIPPAQLTGSLVASILKRADINLDTAIASARAYAIYAAMRCVPAEIYRGMVLPDGTKHIADDEYQQMLPALCGIEALLVYTDAITPRPTPNPVVPDPSNSGA